MQQPSRSHPRGAHRSMHVSARSAAHAMSTSHAVRIVHLQDRKTVRSLSRSTRVAEQCKVVLTVASARSAEPRDAALPLPRRLQCFQPILLLAACRPAQAAAAFAESFTPIVQLSSIPGPAACRPHEGTATVPQRGAAQTQQSCTTQNSSRHPGAPEDTHTDVQSAIWLCNRRQITAIRCGAPVASGAWLVATLLATAACSL